MRLLMAEANWTLLWFINSIRDGKQAKILRDEPLPGSMIKRRLRMKKMKMMMEMMIIDFP